MIISELLRYLMLCISSLEAPLIIVLYAKIGNINVWFASEFLVDLYFNMCIYMVSPRRAPNLPNRLEGGHSPRLALSP